MKTPLTRHIEWLEIRINAYPMDSDKHQAYSDALKDAKMLLEYEKQLITNAELSGFYLVKDESQLGNFWNTKINNDDL
jgi:RNA-splicing ligase RtcB